MCRLFSCTAAAALSLVSSLFADEVPSPVASQEPEGMVQLVGEDLWKNWKGDPRLWSLKEGTVRGETTKENVAKGNTFLIWTGGTLSDFELRLSFRIKGGNSGVQYRSKQVDSKSTENRWVVAGYQAEVEDTPGKVGFLYHERGRGYLCNVGDKVEIGADGKPKLVAKLGKKETIGATYKKSDWNDYVIIAEGNRLRHYLNGVQTVDVVDNDPKGRALSGLLALQIHAGDPMVVEFKNVRLKQAK
jgi:hypothetical protein